MAGKSTRPVCRKRPLTQGESFLVSVLSGLAIMVLVAGLLYLVAVRLNYALNPDWSLNVLASSSETEEVEEVSKPERLPTPPPPPTPPRLPPPPIPPPPIATLESISTQSLVALNQEQLELLEQLEDLEPTEPVGEPPPEPPVTENTEQDERLKEFVEKRNAERAAAEKKKAAEARRSALALKLASPPIITRRHVPTYPDSARRAGREGRVIVKVTVTAKGTASAPRVISSSGNRELDDAALSAARRFLFKPARNGLGQAIAAPKDLPFTFQLRAE